MDGWATKCNVLACVVLLQIALLDVRTRCRVRHTRLTNAACNGSCLDVVRF